MRSNTYGILFITSLAVAAAAVIGCAGISWGFDNKPYYSGSAAVEKIDEKLTDGPVFLMFGDEWCQYCRNEKPIIQNLSKKYGSVTFIEVDTEKDPRLAISFMVSGIPQIDIIVRKNADGSYLYVGPDGNTTSDRQASRIIGFTGQEDLEKLLDAAVDARKYG